MVDATRRALREGRGLAGTLFLLVAAAVAIGGLLLGSAVLARSGQRSIPDFSHVYVIVLENKSPDQMRGATYLNDLGGRYAVATDYQGIGHPSQPNYLALFSGSTQGVTNDNPVDLNAANLADQLDAHGKTWRVYAENYPGNCFTGNDASNGPDGAGFYVRRHNPAIEFTDISRSPTRCANIQPLRAFDPAAADFELIAPNMCHDMHDCPVAAGDAFLRSFVPKILDSSAFKQGGVLVITADEGGDGSGAEGGVVPTTVVGPSVPAGFRSSVEHDHYSLLRTIEDAWHLGCLASSCAANNLGEFFH